MSTPWTPPPDQVISSTAPISGGWTPPPDQVITHSDQTIDNRRWDQKAADFFQPLSDAADRIQGTMPAVGALMNPSYGLAQYAGSKINEAAGGLAQPVTESLGKAGVPGPAAAALGMGASIAANPFTYLDPGAGFAGKMLEPVIPAERAFDVATAQKYNLPMTRADLTGGVGTARVETGLSGTMTGGGAFQDIAAQKLAAIEKAKTSIGNKFGTNMPPSASGTEAQLSMQDLFGAIKQKVELNYKEIPNDNIPTSGFEKSLDNVDFRNIDKSAHPIINDIRARLGKQPFNTEETSPTPFSPQEQGVNPKTANPGDIIRPSQSQYRTGPASPDLPVVENNPLTTGEPHAVFQGNMDYGDGNTPSTYILRGDHPRTGGNFNGQQLSDMGIPVRGQLAKAVGQTPDYLGEGAKPASVTQFQKLNDIRNLLSKEIQKDTQRNVLLGNQVGPKGQALIPLKKALDQDLQDYVKNNKTNPLGKMMSEDFSQKFNRANSFYGAYKNLQQNKFVQKLSKADPSELPATLFGGSVEDLNVGRKALGKEGYAAAKQQFFNTLLNSKNIETQLSKYTPEFLKGAFNGEELNALREAASLKKTSLTAEKLAGNPSGTAQRVLSSATMGGLGALGYRALTHPVASAVEAAGILGGPYLASKAYLGSTYGVPYSIGGPSVLAAKAAAGTSSSNRPDVHAEFLRRFVKRSQ